MERAGQVTRVVELLNVKGDQSGGKETTRLGREPPRKDFDIGTYDYIGRLVTQGHGRNQWSLVGCDE
jgi:hypothetical protein